MMEPLKKLEQLIQEEASKLICETHPECCRMRDENYAHFQTLVVDLIFQEDNPVSVQTALAQLEQELEHL